MELKKPAIAGTTESSDAMITVMPNGGAGIQIQIDSVVFEMFGASIEHTVHEVLEEFDVHDAEVTVVDKGALDCTIRARLQCAICRSAEIKYNWGKDDQNG